MEEHGVSRHSRNSEVEIELHYAHGRDSTPQSTILSGHRSNPPFGMAGGENGQVGQNSVRRNDGSVEKLKGCDATTIDAGEALIIQTPTAGGYGKPGR